MEDPKVDDTTVATADESQTIGLHNEYMTSTARHAALKLGLPPPGDPPAFKIAYWDESGDLGISARYLTITGGPRRRRIGDANDNDIMDMTAIYTPTSIPLSRASPHTPFSEQNNHWNEDPNAALEECNESELALESWIGEVRGRIKTSRRMRRTKDDVSSKNSGPAGMSRDLEWFYHNRLTRWYAAAALPSDRTPSERALLESGFNAAPIPSEFAHEISAKARLDGPRTEAKLCYADNGLIRHPHEGRHEILEKLERRKHRKPSGLAFENTLLH